MKTILDTNLLQLMASKICHDLISPVGAIGNGVELVEELGADALEDALPLIKMSSTLASSKLKAYRIAYGAGGADGHITPENVKNAIEGIISGDGKITQDWTADANMAVPDDHYERPPAYCKLLICVLLLALDCLPRGGNLSVQADGTQTVVHATGQSAGFREEIEDALMLALENETLEPKHAHAALTGMITQEYGYTISATSSPDSMSITFIHPKRAPIV